MDVNTLNAVIAMLQQEVNHCHEMIRWSFERQEAMGSTKDLDMWCNSKVEAQACLNKVQKMLDDELLDRVVEAAS